MSLDLDEHARKEFISLYLTFSRLTSMLFVHFINYTGLLKSNNTSVSWYHRNPGTMLIGILFFLGYVASKRVNFTWNKQKLTKCTIPITRHSVRNFIPHNISFRGSNIMIYSTIINKLSITDYSVRALVNTEIV